jgi:hypothetical protein
MKGNGEVRMTNLGGSTLHPGLSLIEYERGSGAQDLAASLVSSGKGVVGLGGNDGMFAAGSWGVESAQAALDFGQPQIIVDAD